MQIEQLAISIALAILLAAIIGIVVGALCMRSNRTLSERVRELTDEIEALTTAKAETANRLAAEQVKACRVDELEQSLREATDKLDAAREAKSTAESTLATAQEALRRVEERVADLQSRLQAAEQAAERGQEARANVEKSLSAYEESVRQGSEASAELRRQVAAADERLKTSEKQIAQLQADKAAAERAVTEKATVIARMEKAADDQTSRLDKATLDLEAARREIAHLREEIAKLRETLEQERKQAGEKIELLTAARQEMTNQFHALAEGIMTRHGENFTRANKEQLEALLDPLRLRIREFDEKVTATHTESVRERATLAEQIRQIAETGTAMSRETKELAEALRGSSQSQGAWGEMILDTILERSGLREGEHYDAQRSFANDDGGRVRPDVVVNLPGGKKVVVDAKVSLTAFDAMVNSTSPEERAQHLQRHLASMRSHVGVLSSKNYHIAAESMLDYVVMFVPIEGALAVAIQADPSLTSFAAERNVAITTPTTLMIALRTVANVWHVETRNRNAEDIARRAGLLYDKFAGFVDDMNAIGASIDKARLVYDEAMKKLTTGRGNVIRQFERLRAMGARAVRTLPTGLLETAQVIEMDSEEEEAAAISADDTEPHPEPVAQAAST